MAKVDWREKGPYWTLIAFLVLVFLTGGASRSDVVSLIILRPAAVLVCGIALWTLSGEQVKAHRFLFAMATAIIALVGSHIIPLPPPLWGALPGRELITEIDKAAGHGDVWRPLTMVPSGGWNAFYSLFVPLAVLLLGVQLTREQRFDLLPWLIGLGLFSGFVGLMQLIGDPQGPLYLYRVTNNGSAVGLFANRNHQAVLLATLFPMLAIFSSAGIQSAEQAKLRAAIGIASATALVPLLLITGSRAGLIIGLTGLLAAALLYQRPQATQPKKRKVITFDPKYAIAAFGAIILGGLTVVLSRAEALERLLIKDPSEELRLRLLQPVGNMVWQYFPLGSGAGSFVEAFQIGEPSALLKPTYVNHAHNDWLEHALLFGLPGLVLLAAAIFAFVRRGLPAWRSAVGDGRDIPFARLGSVAIIMLAISSVVDYPLRTPTLACLFVVFSLWLSANGRGALEKSAGV